MDKWIKDMAKELGLPETATQEQVLAKLGERFAALSGADTRNAGIAAQLAAFGLKLDGDKLVKLEQVQSNPADVARIAALELDAAKQKLANGKAQVDALIAAGKVPPAMKDALTRVFSTTGKMESLALSKEGNTEVVIKGPIDILADLKALFDSIPAVTGGKLSTYGAGAPTNGGKAPGTLGREVARRNQPNRKEPAAK